MPKRQLIAMPSSQGEDILPCHPTPVLERLLADTPSTREVSKTPHMRVMMRECECMFIVIQVQFSYLAIVKLFWAQEITKGSTFILIVSASTFASAHRFVRGGNMAVEPNMIISVVYASW